MAEGEIFEDDVVVTETEMKPQKRVAVAGKKQTMQLHLTSSRF